MDIKDFILVGGGLLIAAVVVHGFWIAWRARREPLRLDIVPDLFRDDPDEFSRFRAELPNGGGRLVRRSADGPEQVSLDLDTPVLMEPVADSEPLHDPSSRTGARRAIEPAMDSLIEPVVETVIEPVTDSAVAGSLVEPIADSLAASKTLNDERGADSRTGNVDRSSNPSESSRMPRARVTDVEMADIAGSRTTARPVEPIVSDPSSTPPTIERAVAEHRSRRRSQPKQPERTEPVAESVPVDELIVINIMAAKGRSYTGDELFAALRGKGLKFGDMNIFHRQDPMTKAIQYSAANVIEPGIFDMADMESLRTPGICLIMQLPGPDKPMDAFSDMLAVARAVAQELGGELKDDQRSVMTKQTVTHCQQRIADFSRRRMSKRA